ncbi:uncharacterized protein LOC106058427 isoform X5 [Biomphalaria glabrata]|uniref:Uncharacterized protein LOC106058427 isoform X5 n=1 Tax=Biomphalaria glabrata TaxID=6526 RepID=A0A9W3AJD8_BIOGL|nr:uncharacterized protein LOC106058427 isoform X5 [Biomphalaria glabrata]
MSKSTTSWKTLIILEVVALFSTLFISDAQMYTIEDKSTSDQCDNALLASKDVVDLLVTVNMSNTDYNDTNSFTLSAVRPGSSEQTQLCNIKFRQSCSPSNFAHCYCALNQHDLFTFRYRSQASLNLSRNFLVINGDQRHNITLKQILGSEPDLIVYIDNHKFRSANECHLDISQNQFVLFVVSFNDYEGQEVDVKFLGIKAKRFSTQNNMKCVVCYRMALVNQSGSVRFHYMNKCRQNVTMSCDFQEAHIYTIEDKSTSDQCDKALLASKDMVDLLVTVNMSNTDYNDTTSFTLSAVRPGSSEQTELCSMGFGQSCSATYSLNCVCEHILEDIYTFRYRSKAEISLSRNFLIVNGKPYMKIRLKQILDPQSASNYKRRITGTPSFLTDESTSDIYCCSVERSSWSALIALILALVLLCFIIAFCFVFWYMNRCQCLKGESSQGSRLSIEDFLARPVSSPKDQDRITFSSSIRLTGILSSSIVQSPKVKDIQSVHSHFHSEV